MATWGIHHTSLSVSDADQSLRFYRDGLGLKLVGDSTERSQRLAEEVEVPGAWARCLWLETTDGHALLELGAFMTAPQGTQYQALCTHGDHLYLAYQKGGCAHVSVHSRQGAHLEGTSLGGEYVVRNWLSAEKRGGTCLRAFAVKGLGFPCMLELQPGTPPPSRFLSVECFSETSQLRATCHVDSPTGQ